MESNFEENLLITDESRMYLAETAKWAKFLAIVGFVFTALIVVLGVFFGSIMGAMMSGFPEESGSVAMGGLGGAMGFFYVIMGLIYFFPCYYLYKFATRAKLALANNDTDALTDALANHKSVYKFMGILMIIVLAFYVLGIAAALLFGMTSGL